LVEVDVECEGVSCAGLIDLLLGTLAVLVEVRAETPVSGFKVSN
jgi:hypothetical protein